MVKGTSQSITEPRRTRRCQRDNERLRTERISDGHLRGSRRLGEIEATVDQNLPRQGVRRIDEARDLREGGTALGGIERIARGEIDEVIAEEIEADPRVHTVETAVRLTIERGTARSSSDLGLIILGAKVPAETRESEVQADGDRSQSHPRDHESRHGQRTRVRMRNRRMPRSQAQLTKRRIVGITCRPVTSMVTPPVRATTPAMVTLPRHPSRTLYHHECVRPEKGASGVRIST